MPVTPASRKQLQKDQKLQTSLGDIVGPHLQKQEQKHGPVLTFIWMNYCRIEHQEFIKNLGQH